MGQDMMYGRVKAVVRPFDGVEWSPVRQDGRRLRVGRKLRAACGCVPVKFGRRLSGCQA